jgi:hypothetical protein
MLHGDELPTASSQAEQEQFDEQCTTLNTQLQSAETLDAVCAIKQAMLSLRNKMETVPFYFAIEKKIHNLNLKLTELDKSIPLIEHIQQQLSWVKRECKEEIFRDKARQKLEKFVKIVEADCKLFPALQVRQVASLNTVLSRYKKSAQVDLVVPAEYCCSKTQHIMLQPVLWQGRWYERCMLPPGVTAKPLVDAIKVRQIRLYLTAKPEQLLQFLLDQERLNKNYDYAKIRGSTLKNWVDVFAGECGLKKAQAAIRLAQEYQDHLQKNSIIRKYVNRFFPYLHSARQIMNNRKLSSVCFQQPEKDDITLPAAERRRIAERNEQLQKNKLEQRQIIVKRLRTHDYRSIAEDKDSIAQAIYALKMSRSLAESKKSALSIDYTQAAVAIEIANLSLTYGTKNIEFHTIFDEGSWLTDVGFDYLYKMFARWQNDERYGLGVFIPAKYRVVAADSDAQKKILTFIHDYRECFEELPWQTSLFYKITLPDNTADDDAFYEEALFDAGDFSCNPPYICSLSYGAINIMGAMLFQKHGKNLWLNKEYRIGVSSIPDLFNTQLRGARVVAVGPTPPHAHGTMTKPAEFTAHDEFHRVISSAIAPEIRAALERISFLIRSINITSSQELWAMIDRGILTSLHEAEPTQHFCEMIADSDTEEHRFWQVNNDKLPSVVVWLIVMDMVDQMKLWQEQLKINPEAKEFVYQRQINQYKKLKQHIDFRRLDIKQKIIVLEQIQFFPFQVGAPTELNIWARYDLTFVVPESKLLAFKKNNTKPYHEDFTLNQIYLQCDQHNYRLPYYQKIKQILNSKEDINVRNARGETALYLAVQMRYKDLIRELLLREADLTISCHGETVLDVALMHHDREVYDLLTDHQERFRRVRLS